MYIMLPLWQTFTQCENTRKQIRKNVRQISNHQLPKIFENVGQNMQRLKKVFTVRKQQLCNLIKTFDKKKKKLPSIFHNKEKSDR